MRVFISWSGPVSKQVAMALRSWLPTVLQSLDPFVSSEDIDKGARWGADIAKHLDNTNYGIVCLTPDNLESPWLNFEVGALSKSVDIARVTPFLHRVTKTSVKPPLGLFQATDATKDDVLLLVKSLNAAAGDLVPEAGLVQQVNMWWPTLENALTSISAPASASAQVGANPPARPERDMLEELLSLVRELAREQGSSAESLRAAQRPTTQASHGRTEAAERLVAKLAERQRNVDLVEKLLAAGGQSGATLEASSRGSDLRFILPPQYELTPAIVDLVATAAASGRFGVSLLDYASGAEVWSFLAP